MPLFASTRLPQVLLSFHNRYPNINVLIDDIIAEQVNQHVRSGRVELGITFRPDDMTDLAFEPLLRDQFVAAIPHQHPLAANRSLTWATITDYPLLLLQQPSSLRGMIEKTLRDNALKASVEMEAHQLATLGKMVAAGLGISVVPTIYVEQLNALGADSRPLTDPVIEHDIGVLYRSNNPLSAAAQAMLELLVEKSGALTP